MAHHTDGGIRHAFQYSGNTRSAFSELPVSLALSKSNRISLVTKDDAVIGFAHGDIAALLDNLLCRTGQATRLAIGYC